MRLSAIGDTCHALAVARRLQDNWPQAKLTWIIGKTEAALLGDVPGVEFIIFDKSRGADAYRNVREQLSDRRFDAVLCLHASFRVNRLYRHLVSPLKIGFDFRRARDGQWLFTNRRVPNTNGKHAMEAMLMFADALGAGPTPVRWDVPLPADAVQFAASTRDSGRSLVAISPCSSQRARNFRNWPVDRYRAVVRHLLQRDVKVLVTGGNTQLENDYGAALGTQQNVQNLVGRTSLKELFALFAEADLVICPDSGPAHMATAAGTPVLGLYASSNPARTGPYRTVDLTVNRYPDACLKYLGKPATALRWGRRVRHPGAMELITIDDVTGKIDEFFER